MNEIRTYVKQIGNIDEGHVSARYHATVSMYNTSGHLVQLDYQAETMSTAVWRLERRIGELLNQGGRI